MKLLALASILIPFTGGPAEPQPAVDQLRIDIRGYTVDADGGEKASVGMTARPLVIGGRTAAAISFSELGRGNCNLKVAPTTIDAKAIAAWRVSATPLRVQGDAVTFRLEWERVMEDGRAVSEPRAQREATLRAGQSLPLLIFQPSPASRCGGRGASLRVSVDFDSDADYDRRLVATDLWLVERKPGGREASQQVSLRGRFDETQRFYFDDVQEGAIRLDIYGDVIAHPRDGSIELQLTARRRFSHANEAIGPGLPFSFGVAPFVLRVKPDDVAEIQLPAIVEKESGAFRNRSFSLRARTQQIRPGDSTTNMAVSAITEPRFYVLGRVNRPGPQILRGEVTVDQAIALAGGIAADANLADATIVRRENDQTVKLAARDAGVLRRNDVLTVPARPR
ncbi:MAG: hypothetical protein A3H96_06360 [Acidobacteria bacterium RIFCSPLOWO2_02_FULL_67_36]|nr:MAG: hypothetical protein A3H96_06360 [Acidobacteria bacterium RIFCSPLOWO2_02_FULL_67_36]OFW25906.1 MAG: hypothetical protein A3G21_15200 [Acidobacteria bacterium RIFCSPLOWO2_12_FULL_66_21]